MKKTFFLFLLLLLLGIGSICYVTVHVNAERNRVTITEKVLVGERAAAKGIQVLLATHYDNHLFWDTVYRPGQDGAADTEFRFYANRVEEKGERDYSGISLECSIEYGIELNEDISALEGIALVYREMYDSLEPGEEMTRTVYLKDYYDFYPLYGEINLPGYRGGFHGLALNMVQGMELAEVAKIQEYFRIPVLEEETRSVSVHKDSESSWGIGGGSTDSDSYYMYTLSALREDACYFTFDVHSALGKVMDTGYLPEGYGIYKLPYHIDEESKSKVDWDGLSMVYELNPDNWLLHLVMNEEKDKLLLTTEENNKLYLTVIDIEKMELLQKVEIGEIGEGYITQQAVYDDFILWSFSDERIALVTLREGRYQLEFVVDAQVPESYRYSGYSENAMDWNGEKLVIGAFRSEDSWYDSSCGFYLTVYDKKGLVYCGEYTSSLDVEYRENKYSYQCKPVVGTPMVVSWE